MSETEVRGVVRLLAEALAPDDGRNAKCQRVMDGLCELVGADGWVWVRSRVDDTSQPINIDHLYGGAVDALCMGRLAERMLAALGPGSEFAALDRQIAPKQHVSMTRPQLVADPPWRADATMRSVRQSGLDEFIYSWFPVPDGDRGVVWSGGWFYREVGRDPFDPGDARLVHLVMGESGVLHAEGLDLSQEGQLMTLTHKQRVVLSQLVYGQPASSIAEHLELSIHTVNDHIKAIYRHFRVSSRAELMARFLNVDCGVGDG